MLKLLTVTDMSLTLLIIQKARGNSWPILPCMILPTMRMGRVFQKKTKMNANAAATAASTKPKKSALKRKGKKIYKSY